MTLSRSKIFLTLCLGLIGGVFLGRFINYEIMVITAMFFVMIVAIGWKNPLAVLIGVTGIVALLGAWRFQIDYRQNDIAQFYNQKISGVAVVTEEPDVRSDKTYLTLGQIEINQQKLKSKILATVSLFPQYEYGQKIQFTAKLSEPKDFPDFSYKNYLSRFGVDAVIYYPKVKAIPGNFGNKIKYYILKLKQKFTETVNQVLPEPQASFLGGLLLGARRAIPQDLTDKFNQTGTSHIVAVSGYNITIIVGALTWALGRFRKRTSFILSLIAIFMFVIMTGASASVIRAGIMGALTLVALNIGRLFVVDNALALAAAVMLIINPQILHFDVGFQLSFAALLGLVYFTPVIEKYFLWIPDIVRPYLLATLSAQVFTLPILLANFGILSLVAPIANILVLPLVPITMLFGFLTGFAGLIWLKLALPFAGITWLLLTYIIKVITFLANLPFAAVNFKFNMLWVSGYYLAVFIILYLYHYQWNPKLKNL